MQHEGAASRHVRPTIASAPASAVPALIVASVLLGCSGAASDDGGSMSGLEGAQADGSGARGTATLPDVPMDIGPLCDGSDDVRLMAVSNGTFTDPYLMPYAYDPFIAAYGGSFLFVDGQCRFWRGRAEAPVYSGTLDAVAAASFAEAVSFGHFRRWASFNATPGCDDGAAYSITAPDGEIACWCDCSDIPGADPEFERAFAAAFDPAGTFTGEPVTGSARVATVRAAAGEYWHPPQPWPLSTPPTHFEAEVLITEDAGAVLTEPDDVLALRALQATYLEQDGNGPGVRVVWRDPETDADLYFDLLVRELLPPAVLAGREALLGDRMR